MINRNEIKLTKEKKEEKLELGSNIIFAYLHKEVI